MSKNIDLAFAKTFTQKLLKVFVKHGAFIAILTVLVAYLFVVWQISKLASAEPTPEQQSAALAATNIPKVSSKDIEAIQSLEQSSTQIHSLFDAARNNPFQE